MSTALGQVYETYPCGSGDNREWMLSFGDSTGQQILVLSPLFEELNFTRRLVVEIGRTLGARGIGVWIPDLPACGESRRELVEIGWDEWRAAANAAGDHILRESGRLPHVASFRGGSLLDDAPQAASRWRYAPAAGADLLRQMRRAQGLSDREAGGAAAEDEGIVHLVGYRMRADLVDALQSAVPGPAEPLRTVPAAAGTAPLWRRAEPGDDPDLAARLADDLHEWIAACAG